MLDYFLWALIIFVGLDLLFTIFNNDNSEKVLMIINSSDKFKSKQFRSLSIIDTDETNYDFYSNNDFEKIEFDMDEIKDCYNLLNEFNSCLSLTKEITNECQEIINNKLFEFEKCNLLYTSLSLGNINKEFHDLLENEEDINDDIFELIKIYEKNEDKNGDIKEEVVENEEIIHKKEAMFEEIIKESSILKNNKDCIEYELSENDDDLIKCVKYE